MSIIADISAMWGRFQFHLAGGWASTPSQKRSPPPQRAPPSLKRLGWDGAKSLTAETENKK